MWSFLSSCQESRILYRYRFFCILVSKVWLKKQKKADEQVSFSIALLLRFVTYDCIIYISSSSVPITRLLLSQFLFLCLSLSCTFIVPFTFTLINIEYQPLLLPSISILTNMNKNWDLHINVSIFFFSFFFKVNHYLVESKENIYNNSTATTILNILKVYLKNRFF